MIISYSEHYWTHTVGFLHLVPQHTGGWSQRESLENAVAAERKRGVSALGNISLGGARCVQTCSRETLADVSQLTHHGLDLN